MLGVLALGSAVLLLAARSRTTAGSALRSAPSSATFIAAGKSSSFSSSNGRRIAREARREEGRGLRLVGGRERSPKSISWMSVPEVRGRPSRPNGVGGGSSKIFEHGGSFSLGVIPRETNPRSSRRISGEPFAIRTVSRRDKLAARLVAQTRRSAWSCCRVAWRCLGSSVFGEADLRCASRGDSHVPLGE